MAGWTVKPLISQLGDGAFDRFKHEFAKTYKHIHAIEGTDIARTLVGILCNREHLKNLQRDELAAVIDSVFSQQMNSIQWLNRYMCYIVALLPIQNVNKHIGYTDRAERFYVHVHDNLPKTMSQLVKSGKGMEDEDVRDTLRDQVRIVFALNNEWNKVGYDSKQIKDINLKLSGKEDAVRLWYHIHPVIAKAPVVKTPEIKIPFDISQLFPPANTFQKDDKQLAILLTRIFLCEALENDE